MDVQPRFADSHLSAPVRDAQDHSADCEQDQQRDRHGYPGRWHPIFRRNVSSVAEHSVRNDEREDDAKWQRERNRRAAEKT